MTITSAAFWFSDSNLKAGQTVTVGFTFNEAVSQFDASAITAPHVRLSAPVVDSATAVAGASTIWRVTLTPDANTTALTNVLTVDLSAVKDSAGNPGTGSSGPSNNYIVDTVAPTLNSIAVDKTIIRAGETANVVFTFSEPVDYFEAADVTVPAGCTLSDLHLAGTPIFGASAIWAATLTAAGGVQQPVNTLKVNLAGVYDAADNAGVGLSAPSANYAVDTMQPALTAIRFDKPVISTGASVGVNFAFSEAVRGFNVNNISAPHGRLSNLHAVDDSGNTIAGTSSSLWRATLTADNDVEDNTNTLRIDLGGVQNAAGSACRDSSRVSASANYSVDSKAPQLTAAAVAGNQLVLSYAEGLRLDALNPPASSAFTVSGAASTVTAVAVDAAARTVALTLGNAVAAGQTVTVSYTDPTAGNDASAVQDEAGNDAASFSGRAVSNDRLRPTLAATNGIVIDNTALGAGESANVTFTFSEAVTGFDLGDVSAPNARLGALHSTDGGTTWKATLTPVTVGIEDASNVLSVNLSGVSNTAGAHGLGSGQSANYIVDNVMPGYTQRPTVSGNQLVISYSDGTGFDAVNLPARTAFSVSVDGSDNPITGMTADAAAQTLTLTLTRAVTDGQTVSLAYTDPTPNDDSNAIQDLAGNDEMSIPGMTVLIDNTPRTDTTPPKIRSATVDGRQLVLGYYELNRLDDMNLAPASAFTVKVNVEFTHIHASLPMLLTTNASTNAVTAMTVDALAKTVTLTLATPVSAYQNVVISYQDPSAGNDTNAVQDTDGNDAISFTDWRVRNYTRDTDPPLLSRATVNGNRLVLGYTDAYDLDAAHPAPASAFAVNVNGSARAVTAAAVDAWNQTVTLMLASAVVQGDTVNVSYTDPTDGNDSNAVQDANDGDPDNMARYSIEAIGNDAASFTDRAVANDTPDSTVPVLDAATVSGRQLVLRYTEANRLDAVHKPPANAFVVWFSDTGNTNEVTAVAVDGAAKTVTLTLTTEVSAGQTLSINYSDPTSGNDSDAIQDEDGNDADGFSGQPVRTATPDNAAPVLVSATVNGRQLVLGYSDANALDAAHTAPTAAFAVSAGSGGHSVANNVTHVAVDADAKTVTLTLADAVAPGQTILVSYTDPGNGNDANAVQDADGNDAASFSARVADNTTSATPPPPTPAPEPAPIPEPAAAPEDADKDGTPNAVEDRAPGIPGPDGAAPVAGDGNGDGEQDSGQSAVGSVALVTGGSGAGKPADAALTWATLVADSRGGKPGADSADTGHAQISSLEQKDAPAELPRGLEMPVGLVHFSETPGMPAAASDGAPADSSETFSLYVDAALGVNGYWMQDGAGHWVNLASAPLGGAMQTAGDRLRLDFQISDGGPFDADGKADGAISAAGAPARMPLSITGQAPDTVALDGFWF